MAVVTCGGHHWVTRDISNRLIINIVSHVLLSACCSFQYLNKAKTKTAVSIKANDTGHYSIHWSSVIDTFKISLEREIIFYKTAVT